MNMHGHWPRPRRILEVLAFAALVGSCTALQPPRIENLNLYVLAAEPLPKTTQVHRDVVIDVAPPWAWPGFDTPQMVYVRQSYELDYFAASRWADTPTRMLGPLLARALEQSGGFRAVLQEPTSVPADFRVDTELVRLQQNFTARPSRVELTLRVQLTDVHGKRVIAARVFEETETAPSEDANGGVMAANAALQRMLEEVADFCITESASR